MIEVTRLSGSTVVLNADLIEKVEATPDTVVTLTNGACYVVQESVESLIDEIVRYKSRVLHCQAPANSPHPSLTVLPGTQS
jgi:flagellar protein FlbD